MPGGIPVGDGMAAAAAVRGQNRLFLFQHQNFLAEHPRAERGARERARHNQAVLAVRVCHPGRRKFVQTSVIGPGRDKWGGWGGGVGAYSFVACLSHLAIDHASLETVGGGGGAYLFVACLSHSTIYHASLSRRSTVPTPITE